MSQSPQAGQFNSYGEYFVYRLWEMKVFQSPQAGQFNSYVKMSKIYFEEWSRRSQSPQAGQFNSYTFLIYSRKIVSFSSQSPQAGQFNSYLIVLRYIGQMTSYQCLNPLKRVNSILTSKCIGEVKWEYSLNPLKRVNSILTLNYHHQSFILWLLSQSPQAGQFNSYRRLPLPEAYDFVSVVSIPSSGSIQFLPGDVVRWGEKSAFVGLNPLKRINSILTEAGRNLPVS